MVTAAWFFFATVAVIFHAKWALVATVVICFVDIVIFKTAYDRDDNKS
jgi:hypothetical protein